MKYIDMHCDTLAEALVRKQKTVRKLKGDDGRCGTPAAWLLVDVPHLSDGGLIAQCIQMELFFDALHKRGIKEGILEKIAFRNVERVLRESVI